ncbi:MAG: TonB-dependent receptor [Rhodocyclaceae bacterium]
MHPGTRCAALAAFLVIPVQPCLAAEDAAVVVTATRFSSEAAENADGIQVITAGRIRESGATSLAEVLNRIGGVHTRISFLGTPDQPIDLRGFGATGDQNTLVLLDGERISENELASARLSIIPLNAIERIEILRGSGAVLYGGGASAGAINIITRPAGGGRPEALLQAGVGSYKTTDARASARTAGEGWGLALDANRYDSDNYRRNNAARQENIAGEWRALGSAGSLALRFGADRQRARLPGARTEAQLASDPRGSSTPDDFSEIDGWRIGMSAQTSFGALTAAADVGYRVKASRAYFAFPGGSSLSDVDSRVLSVSPRLKWSGAPGGLANVLVAGVDLSDWDYRNDSVFTFFGFPSPTRESAIQRNAALYLQDRLRIGPATRIGAGLRHERVRVSSEESVTPIARRGRSDALHAWELSLRHELPAGPALYGRIGRSFRIANVDENRCFFPPCADPLLPQTSHDREVGLEYRRHDGRLRAALFEMALANEIHFNALTFQNVNLSPTRRRGLELDGSVKPLARMELSARYAWTQALFRSGSYGGVDVAGNAVPLVPRQRAGISLAWQAGAGTRLAFDVSHVGRQRYDNDQANRFREMPSYTIADARLSHRYAGFTLTASVNNLFDRKYYSYAITDSPTAPTTFSAYPERRRSLMVSAELSLP